MTNDEEVQLIREAPISYVDGMPVPSDVPQIVPLQCNVQPLGSKDLMLLPEGERTQEQFWLFVPPGQAIVPMANDKIIRDGQLFQVQGVRDWQTFQKVRMMRIDAGAQSYYSAPIVAVP